MLNGKVMIVHLIIGSIKRHRKFFPEPKSLGGKVKVELDLFNYGTEADLKNVIDGDTSSFTKKVDSANLTSHADKLDIDKLKNVPTNFSNLKIR